LYPGVHIADLIEKKSASVCNFYKPLSVPHCVCESASCMPEKFTRKQITLESGTIHLDKGCGTAKTVVMEPFGQNAFPRTGFT
jgi:hypothetical protein